MFAYILYSRFAHYENYNRQQMLTDVQVLSLGAVPPLPSPVVLGYGTVAGLTGMVENSDRIRVLLPFSYVV